jgi:hypothetical protein
MFGLNQQFLCFLKLVFNDETGYFVNFKEYLGPFEYYLC